MSNYQSGYKSGKSLELVGNAVCTTDTQWDSLATQAWGMSMIMGLPYEDNTRAPKLYPVERPSEQVYEDTTIPEEEAESVSPEAASVQKDVAAAALETRNIWIPVGIGGISILAVAWMISPKRPGKKHRRERPKMNWDVE